MYMKYSCNNPSIPLFQYNQISVILRSSIIRVHGWNFLFLIRLDIRIQLDPDVIRLQECRNWGNAGSLLETLNIETFGKLKMRRPFDHL